MNVASLSTGLVGTVAVSDLLRSIEWYSLILEREPDSLPVDGLAQWDLSESGHLQLLTDSGRAGHSVVTLSVTDVYGWAARAPRTDLDLSDVTDVDVDAEFARTCTLTDPDGNTFVLAELV